MNGEEEDLGEVTRLLRALEPGDPRRAVDRLLPLLYGELHRLAEARMRGEDSARTLSPTALVHEAFIKLAEHDRVEWKNRAHFLAVAALAMRRVLLRAAEARQAEKRGGKVEAFITFEEDLAPGGTDPESVIELDTTLEALAAHSPRQAKVVELRIFAGMTIEEIAGVLDISPPTAQRDWRFGRAWLATRMEQP